MNVPNPTELLDFWKAAGRDKWFAKDDAFDAELRTRFEPWLAKADAGELAAWEQSAETALSLVILLDQIPRNIYRDDPRAFVRDGEALRIAEAALARSFDFKVDDELRPFFYMPLMHAEDLSAQGRCVALMSVWGDPDNLRFAELHRDIIARFGRFPHRNDVLGRETTAEEERFLDEGGFAG